jgi:hypothetical protein
MFSAVSTLELPEFSWNSVFGRLNACSTSRTKYLFRYVCGCIAGIFLKGNTYLVVPQPALYMMKIWLLSLKNGCLTRGSTYILGYIRSSETFIKLRTSYTGRIGYKMFRLSRLKGALLGEQVPFRLYLPLVLRGFPENSYQEIITHAQEMMRVLLKSVNNELPFSWRTKYLSADSSFH